MADHLLTNTIAELTYRDLKRGRSREEIDVFYQRSLKAEHYEVCEGIKRALKRYDDEMAVQRD